MTKLQNVNTQNCLSSLQIRRNWNIDIRNHDTKNIRVKFKRHHIKDNYAIDATYDILYKRYQHLQSRLSL